MEQEMNSVKDTEKITYSLKEKHITVHFLHITLSEPGWLTAILEKGELVAYNKYKNIKVNIDGFKFDSKDEGRRYQELKILNKAGLITNLILQPKFELQAKFRHNKKAIASICYIADFSYNEPTEEKLIVEDVKGMETAVFKIKQKMFLKLYGTTHDLRIIR